MDTRMIFPAILVVMSVLLPAAAKADWREDVGTFRIGMIAPDGGHEVEGVDLMRRAYEGVLGLPVDIFVARSYGALVEAQTSGRIEYAIHSTLSYATAQALCACLAPLAAPVSATGATGIEAVLIRRRGFQSSGTGAQKPVAAPPPSALASAIVLAEIAAALGAGGDTVGHATSAEQAEQEFLAGEADGLIGWAPATRDGAVVGGGTLGRLEEAGADAAALDITWRSGFLPFGPHAVTAGLDEEAIGLLRMLLLTVKDRNPDLYDVLESNRDGGFAEVSEEDYRLAEKVARFLATN